MQFSAWISYRETFDWFDCQFIPTLFLLNNTFIIVFYSSHYFVVLQDSATRFSTSGFFHEPVSPKPLGTPWGPFRIFSKIRGDIHSSRCTTSVIDTGGAPWLADISANFWKKYRRSWGWGETDSWKKPEAKNSWHCPFKLILLQPKVGLIQIQIQLTIDPLDFAVHFESEIFADLQDPVTFPGLVQDLLSYKINLRKRHLANLTQRRIESNITFLFAISGQKYVSFVVFRIHKCGFRMGLPFFGSFLTQILINNFVCTCMYSIVV